MPETPDEPRYTGFIPRWLRNLSPEEEAEFASFAGNCPNAEELAAENKPGGCRSIETWFDVLCWIDSMTLEQQRQRAQILPYDPAHPEPRELHGVIAAGTVGELLGGGTTRSTVDNAHHPEECILTVDCNPFSPEGDICYEVRDDGALVGNKSGKVVAGPLTSRPGPADLLIEVSEVLLRRPHEINRGTARFESNSDGATPVLMEMTQDVVEWHRGRINRTSDLLKHWCDYRSGRHGALERVFTLLDEELKQELGDGDDDNELDD